MPYNWSDTPADGSLWHLSLWPYRSLPPQGFVIFIAATCLMLLLPLIAVLGSPVLWGLLPFLAGTVWLIWHFLHRSYASARLREDLTAWPDRLKLTRTNPRGAAQSWQANPYWVRAELHPTTGPVENYITLQGADRQVELGAFLGPGERLALFDELTARLRALNTEAPRH
jgi:uncharacterized membrane protein